eukprot:365839-Chlamydomonas_euryale.AAC.4
MMRAGRGVAAGGIEARAGGDEGAGGFMDDKGRSDCVQYWAACAFDDNKLYVPSWHCMCAMLPFASPGSKRDAASAVEHRTGPVTEASCGGSFRSGAPLCTWNCQPCSSSSVRTFAAHSHPSRGRRLEMFHITVY